MTKPENSISFDDIMDVFSSVESKPAEEKKAEEKPAVTFNYMPEAVVNSASEPEVVVTKKPETAEAKVYEPEPLPEPIEADFPPPPPLNIPEPEPEKPSSAPAASALFASYNEIGKMIRTCLLAFVNEKAVNHMMLGSLEKTALTYPVLKGTNWDSKEKIREDGSIDVDQACRNMAKDPASMNADIACEALSYLTYVRLKAVKTGAGPERFNQVKNTLMSGMDAVLAGYASSAAFYVKHKIVLPAIKRGDESQ